MKFTQGFCTIVVASSGIKDAPELASPGEEHATDQES